MKKINLKQMVELNIYYHGSNEFCYSFYFQNKKGDQEQGETGTSDLGDIYRKKNNKFVALGGLKKNGLFNDELED